MSSDVAKPSIARKFRMKERVLAPDCYDMYILPENEVQYFVKGSVLSRSGSKTLYSSGSGEKLFKVTENIYSWLQKTYMFDYNAKAVYSLRKAGFLPGRGRNVLKVFRGKEEEDGVHFIDIVTNFARTQFTITEIETKEKLATVSRKALSARRLSTGSDTYEISISAGVDAPFILLLVVCIDEHYNDFNH